MQTRSKEKFLIKCPCGKDVTTTYHRRNIRKFCSIKCQLKYRKKPTPIPRFYKHLLYYTIIVNGKRLLYHRFLMEQHLGIKLSKDVVVHHINENPLDNRLENLLVMSRVEHNNYHIRKKRKARRELGIRRKYAVKK